MPSRWVWHWVCVALLACSGCGRVLGLQEYTGNAGPRPGVQCPNGEAPTESGKCEPVGVDDCGTGFHEDGRSGCTPVLPQTDCPSTGAPTVAWPGKTTCSPISLCSDPWPQSRGQNLKFGTTMYVLPGAPPDGDGSQDRPFSTITAALAAGAGEILVGSGTLVENVVVSQRVYLEGNCAEQTTLQAADPAKPVLAFESGSEGSLVQALAVTGGSDGIVVHGTSNISIGILRIHDVAKAGVVIEDSPAGAPVSKVAQALIERAGERGIVVRGAHVDIATTTIRDVGTANASPAIGSIGVAIHPSRYAPFVAPPAETDGGTTQAIWSPGFSPPSTVTMKDVLVEGMERGVLVEGSTLDASGIAVRDTDRGVVAAFRPEGLVPAALKLTGSTIERSRLVGVDVWNAKVTIDRSTIRGTEATCPLGTGDPVPGAYLGNGIRARYDRNVTFDAPLPDRTLTVTRSVVDHAAQAGVHIEGGALVLDHTLIEDTATEACTNAFGDGVVAYSYDFSPATVRIDTSRIARSQRAAVATFGADVTLAGAMLDCNARDTVRAAATTAVEGESSCGCNGSAAACGHATDAKLARSVIGADCASNLEANCATVCFENIFSPGQVVSGGTVEVLRGERVAPAVTDDTGCATSGGLEPGQRYEAIVFGPGYAAASAGFVAGDGPPSPARKYIPALDDGATGNTQLVAAFWPGYPSDPPPRLDIAGCLGVGIFVCARPSVPVTGGPVTFRDACGSDPDHTGIPGMTVEILPRPAGPLAGPTYSAGPSNPNGDIKTAEGAFTFYLDVPPGDYEAVLHPPPGKTLDCTPDLLSEHLQSAWIGKTDADGSLHLPFRAEPGMDVGLMLYCDAK